MNIITHHTNHKDAALFEKIVPPGIHPDGTMSRQNMETDLRWFLERGAVQGEPDVSRLLDGQYADYAVQQLGKYQP